MNILDLIILIPLAWGGFKGFSRGFVQEIAQFAGLFIAVFAGLYLSDWVASAIINLFGAGPEQTKLISFVIAFVGALILVFLISKAVSRLVESLNLGLVNRLVGAVLGASKYILIISILINMIDTVDKKLPSSKDDVRSKSLLYEPMGKIVPAVLPKVSQMLVTTESDETEQESEDVEE